MTVVVDASAAAAWVANEPDSDAIAPLMASDEELVAPDLLVAEVSNALWKKVRLRAFEAAHIDEALRLLNRSGIRLVGSGGLIGAAVHLGLWLGHPVYDCLYIALAQKLGAPLATFDRRLAPAAQAAAVPLWKAP